MVDASADYELTQQVAPKILPAGWAVNGEHFNVYENYVQLLRVIVTGNRERDGKRWVHVSLSHLTRLPRWSELRDVKDWTIGREKLAIQVLPPESQYVNIHPRCLHLWHCLDGDPVPDFRHDGKI